MADSTAVLDVVSAGSEAASSVTTETMGEAGGAATVDADSDRSRANLVERNRLLHQRVQEQAAGSRRWKRS